jgi:molecular chaperone DnaJ
MDKRDYYEVLEVDRGAAADEIKRAYRKQAMRFHPDRNPGDASAEEMFKEASEAYEVLSDPQKKEVYDRYGHAGLTGQGFQGFRGFDEIFSNFGDIFSEIFGFAGAGARGGGPKARKRGADLRYDLPISFEEAAFGARKDIEVSRLDRCEGCGGSGAKAGTNPEACGTCNGRGQVVRTQGAFMVSTTCPSCRGQGHIVRERCTQCNGGGRTRATRRLSVRIPAGVSTGTRVRLAGEGEQSGPDGTPGDLYVFLSVEQHPQFVRDEFDVHAEVPVGIVTATLGDKISVDTLHGPEKVKIPPGTQPGEVFQLRGKGIPRLDGLGRGDHFVHVRVVVPKDLNRTQRKLLEKFGESLETG